MEWNTDERNEGLQLIGTMGLNMLLLADRLESCGEINGRKLYTLDKRYI